MKSSTILNLFCAATFTMAAAACAPVVDQRGNLPDPEKLSVLKPGKFSKDDIQQLLGSPSTTSLFGVESWYYISSRTETTAFFEPQEVDRMVVAMEFDRMGLLQNIRAYGLKDGKQVPLVTRETPSAGKELSVLEQLLGNVGKFQKDKK